MGRELILGSAIVVQGLPASRKRLSLHWRFIVLIEGMIAYMFIERVLANPSIQKVVLGIGRGLAVATEVGKAAAEAVLDGAAKTETKV